MTEKWMQKRYFRFCLLLASAVLTGLTLIFPKAGFLEWLTLIPAGIFLLSYASDEKVRLRHLYCYGFFFFMCYYLVTFHWFVNLYPLDFIDGMTRGAALAVVLAGWIGLSLLQSIGGGFVFVLAGLVFRSRLCLRFGFLRPFAGGALWAVFEWSQTVGWWGVPWGRLPIGQTAYAVGIQTASLFGSYFITFLLVTFNFLLAYALLVRPALKISCITAACLLVFQYGSGTVLYMTGDRNGTTVRAAAVQGNISSNEKWVSESTQRTMDVYRKYTEDAAKDGASLVVWPETAIPYTITSNSSMGRYVADVASSNRVTVLAGGFTPAEGLSEYNSIVCYLPDGSAFDTVYNKRRLVPFGEFVPMRGLVETLIPPLAELVMVSVDVAQGEGGQVFCLEEGKVGSLICFDSIYEDLTRESVLEGAELIFLSTNDSWFTYSAALYMHNAQAQLRAVETGRYVVRAANTGISTVISSRGEVLALLEPLVDGYICTDVNLHDNMTLYTLIGNSFVGLCGIALAFLLVVELWERISRRREKKNS